MKVFRFLFCCFVAFAALAIFRPEKSFAQCSSAPTVDSPSAISISETSATLGANQAENGGTNGCNADYGVRYSTTTPVGSSNTTLVGTSSTDGLVYSTTVNGLTPGTRYYYTGYSTNSSGTGTSADNGTVFFYTLSSQPSQAGTFSSSPSGTQISLTFPTAASLTASGYLIYRAVAPATPSFTGTDGQTPLAGFIANVTNSGDTEFIDTGLTPGTTYNYILIPYAWDGVNAETYNYNATGAQTTSATVVASEPTNQVTSFAVDAPTITAQSLTVKWVDAVPASVAPSGYLVLARSAAGTFTAFADGSNVPNDSDFSNNNGAINVGVGIQSATFTGLAASTQYFFEIYPYSGSGSTRNYKTSPVVSTNASTIALSTSLTQLTGGVSASPLVAGSAGNANQNAILGFALSSNGSQTVNSITFSFDTDPTNKFSSYGLVSSNDNTFSTTAGQSVISLVTTTPTVTGTGPYKITLTPTTPIDIGSVQYLFLVSTVNGSVTSATVPATITPSLNSADINLSPSTITANSFSGTTYTFQASTASTIELHSSSGITSSIGYATYNTQTASSGLTWGATPNSTSLANFRIRDGGGMADSDSHGTTITSLTFTISNPQDLNAIALFSGTSVNQANTMVANTEVAIGSGTITYNGLSLTAADGQDLFITVRATFSPTSVTDNNTHVVTITNATVSPTGSLLSATPLTNATTGSGATVNNINVMATKVIFANVMPIQANPNADFSVTINATDANGNIDTDHTSQVTLGASGGSGTITTGEGPGGLVKNLVAGTYTWTNVQISLAGNYALSGNHATFIGGNDATGSVQIKSLGVKITDGISATNPLNTVICYSSNFQLLGDIKLSETDPADFSMGTNVTYSIQLPYGYVFDNTVTGAPALTGAEISAASVLSYTSANTVVNFSYTVTGTSELNSILISGLKVKYILASAPSETSILRRGGTAIQEGNDVANEVSHGTVNVSVASNSGYDFEVKALPGQPAVQPNETSFNTTSQPVTLEPAATNPATTNDAFSGNGVSFSNTYNKYLFSPAAVGAGNNYQVTYTALNGAGCQISLTKTFRVLANVINGLQSEYCINDENPVSLSVDPERYNAASNLSVWDPNRTYFLGSTVSYGGQAYRSLASGNLNNVPDAPSSSYWTQWSYIFSNEYVVSLPYVDRQIQGVASDGLGTLTITSFNHGFQNNASIEIYGEVYNDFYFFLFYFSGTFTITNVTTHTFDINYNYPVAGNWTNVYGYAYIPQPVITSVTGVGTNTLTLTAANHGLAAGVTVQIYLDGLNDNGVSTYMYDWYTISNVTPSTFDITANGTVGGSWSGYGQVNIQDYKITTFTPADVIEFNSNYKNLSEYWVGFLVRRSDCQVTSSNTCAPFVLRQAYVKVNQLAIVDFGVLDASYCPDGSAVTLTANQSDGSFFGFGIIDGGANNNTASFNPSSNAITPDTDIVIRYEFIDAKGCKATAEKTTRVFSALATPSAADREFCQGDPGEIQLFATGNPDLEFIWYDAPALVTEVGRGPILNTNLSTASAQTKSYYVIQSSGAGCESASDEATVVIKQAPSATFTPPPPCVDREFTLQGPAGLVSYEWSFGDGNFGSGSPVTHKFETQGSRDIKLTVVASDGCSNSSSITVGIGPNPKPDFTFDQTCATDITQFHATSDIGTTYAWDFGDGNTSAESSDVNRSHQFAASQTELTSFTVELTAYTPNDCFTEVVKEIYILPYLQELGPTDPYVLEQFGADGSGLWSVELIQGTDPLWEFETPTTPILNNTQKSWVTVAGDNYAPDTKVALNSPCLDLSGFSRPIITLDYMCNTQDRADGVVIEFSTNGGVTWTSLGDTGSGINWVNTPSFFSGKIGNSLQGWSGEAQSSWLGGRNSLDQIPTVERSNVRFRFFFSSDNNGQLEGFAFNNLRIEERNRVLLVENFTNQFSPKYSVNNEAFNDIESTESSETVKMQYHIGFPGQDALYLQNVKDPAARAAFYGITNINDLVPRTYVDGYSNGDLTESWFSTEVQRRTLEPAPFTLALSTIAAEPNQLHPVLNITPNVDIVDNDLKLAAFIAVVEKTVDPNEYVLRKILPNPAGTPLSVPLTVAGGTIPIDPGVWNIHLAGINYNNLALIGFVQNQVGKKEILQAKLLENPLNLPIPGPITGSDPSLYERVRIYPNPSDDFFTAILPEEAREDIVVNMTDSFGRNVYTSNFEKGQSRKEIGTKEFAAGLYFVELSSSFGSVKQKVMVVHK